MSATTASGRVSATSGRVSTAARTAAWYGFSGRARVGKTWYSGAAAKRMPAASTSSRQRLQVCNVTAWPRIASARPSAIIGKACPGSPNAPPLAVVLAVCVASLATAALLFARTPGGDAGLRVLFAADLWAVVLVAVVVAFSGRYHSPYTELFLLPVVHAAAFQPRQRVVALIVAALFAFLVPSVAIDGVTSGNAADAMIPALTLILAGGVIYAGAERLRRQRD